MRTRQSALFALALLPSLLTGCTVAASDMGANVGTAQLRASQPASQPAVEQVVVPDVTGKSVSEAKQLLAKLNLAPTDGSADPEPISDETQWRVDSQEPVAGTEVAYGSAVTLSASKFNPTVVLPNVAGQTGDAAKAALEAQGFEIEWADDVWEPSNWIATGTSPKAGDEVTPGSTVTISVMRPPGYDEPSEPATDDYSGLYDDDSDYGYGDDSAGDDYSDGGDYLDGDGDSTDDDGDYSGYEINGGEGNGYVVTCADGAISHSGGIRGACSHHGGVAG